MELVSAGVSGRPSMKITLLLLLFLFSFSAESRVVIELANNYSSDSDNASGTFEYSRMTNQFFLGAAIGKKNRLYFGQNLTQFNRSFTSDGSVVEVSSLELGPRFQYYFSEENTWHVVLTWNPYAKGERTSGGSTDSISGSSYDIALGYQFKVNRSIYMGATITYHALNISKTTDSSNLESEVSHSYSSIYPLLTLSLRFR